MPDFGGNSGIPGSGFDYTEHNDEKSSSQLNLANLILVNLIILIKNSAVVESKLKYGGCQPGIFTPFFTSFREIFDLTSHLISPEVTEEIDDWFEKIDVKETKSLNKDIKNGIILARKLKMEIVKLGMLKIFEDPVTPPFMIDSVLEDMENEEKSDKVVKESKPVTSAPSSVVRVAQEKPVSQPQPQPQPLQKRIQKASEMVKL